MFADRPYHAVTRSLIALLTMSAVLVPMAGHAASRNHDMQKIELRVDAHRHHDRALGPLANTADPDPRPAPRIRGALPFGYQQV